jgi:hypothetical protein
MDHILYRRYADTVLVKHIYLLAVLAADRGGDCCLPGARRARENDESHDFPLMTTDKPGADLYRRQTSFRQLLLWDIALMLRCGIAFALQKQYNL